MNNLDFELLLKVFATLSSIINLYDQINDMDNQKKKKRKKKRKVR